MDEGLSHLRELCSQMRMLQDRKSEMEDELTKVNILIDELRIKKIPELMESLQVKTATFDGLGRVQLASDVHASTREGQRGSAIQWLRDCGYEDMVQETYNASSIKALFRRMIKDGVMPPEEVFNVHVFTRASLVKS